MIEQTQTKVNTLEQELEKIVDILQGIITSNPEHVSLVGEARTYVKLYKRFVQQIRVDLNSGNEIGIQKTQRDIKEFWLKVRDLVNRTEALERQDKLGRKGNLHLIRN